MFPALSWVGWVGKGESFVFVASRKTIHGLETWNSRGWRVSNFFLSLSVSLSFYRERERVHSRLFTRVLFYAGHFAPSRLNISRNADEEASCTFRFPWLSGKRYFNSTRLAATYFRCHAYGYMLASLPFLLRYIDRCVTKWNEMNGGEVFFFFYYSLWKWWIRSIRIFIDANNGIVILLFEK